MPKTRELIELFRAIGSHDLAQAATLSRKLAAQHGAQGHYRAERDLLGALNGAAKPQNNGQNGRSIRHGVLAAHSCRLLHRRGCPTWNFPPRFVQGFSEVIKEWRAQCQVGETWPSSTLAIIFHGPSGCGKSAAAAALASEIELPGFLVRFDSLIGAYLGQTALRLREFFTLPSKRLAFCCLMKWMLC